MNFVLEKSNLGNIFHYDIETYHRLGASGILPRNTELIHGVVVNKMTISPKHSKVVTKLGYLLSRAFSDDFVIRQEKPITIEDSEPEPDISAVKGSYDDFGDKHPETAAFVVEVSFSSLEDDLYKANIYASANISIYWIIDLQNNRIEVFQNPIGGKYATRSTHGLEDKLIIPFTDKSISLAEII